MHLTILDPSDPEQAFPTVESALTEPNGLLAVGGCLSPPRLINAYRQGVFPWYNPEEPILWWSPNPRTVLFPDQIIISKSLKKTLRKNIFECRFDTQFDQVMENCAAPRVQQRNTWISNDIKEAYHNLFHMGIAHCYESWFENELVGGLYGVAIGQVFFGESMFYKKTDASKVAFYHLVQQLADWQYKMIDCQVHTQHLSSLGAIEVERSTFIDKLQEYCSKNPSQNAWLK